MTPELHSLFTLLRAALIQALNAVEDALKLPRSVLSRHERRLFEQWRNEQQTKSRQQ